MPGETPKTDAEWIVHSINIHGLFLAKRMASSALFT